MSAAYALFDTAIGRCALAWRSGRVVAFAVPDENDARTVRRITGRWPDAVESAPSGIIADATEAVRRLLGGEPVDLGFIPVDLTGVSDFERRALEALRRVPFGETVTYGALAAAIGDPGAARAVGMAMGRNPVPVIIPCHRVLGSGGKSGGFSAPGGVATKFRILEIERAQRTSAPMLFDSLPLAVKR